MRPFDKVGGMRSISTRFIVLAGTLSIALSAVILYHTWTTTRRHVEEQAGQQTALALEFALAVREYIGEVVRPEMERCTGPDVFQPETMSTSFVARRIFDRVRERFPEYVIKFSSANPRNPANQAEPRELEIIRYFDDHPDAQEWMGSVELSGERYWAHYTPRRFGAECMRCHGDPADAPASLVERYGSEHGFGLSEGVVALDTVAIPVSRIDTKLAGNARLEMVSIGGILVALLLSLYLVYHFTVARRLALITGHLRQAAAQGDPTASLPMEVCGEDEIGVLASVYNVLVQRLKEEHRQLDDRVSMRTEALRTEIAQREEAEHALQQREERLNSIVRVAPVGIGFVCQRVVLGVNNYLCEMLGYAESELLGCSVEMFYPVSKEYERVVAETSRQMQAAGTGTLETQLAGKDGRVVDVMLSATPIEPGDWDRGITFTVMDITERNRAERERQELEERLRQSQKMEAVGQLAGGVAHDFNNMLQAIQGYTDMALDDLDPSSETHAHLREAREASSRAAQLVGQLLAFSRTKPLRPCSIDLVEVIGGLTKMLHRVIGEHIQLTVTHAPDLMAAFADSGQVEQVLLNLCVNARDAMPEGGTLRIETSNAVIGPECEHTHPWAEAGEYVRIAVIDTGHGMTDDVSAHIFEPFYTTKKVGEGTGMGLATVYGILKQHGGSIDVTSAPGKGTTFDIYLRAASPADNAVQENQRATSTVEGGTETILVAEDDELVRSLNAHILRQAGYKLLVASNGNEAVRLYEEHYDEVDLLLLDAVMPGKNGRDVYDAVTHSTPGVRVVFCSGYHQKTLDLATLPPNRTSLLRKPFNAAELLRAVRHMLDQE